MARGKGSSSTVDSASTNVGANELDSLLSLPLTPTPLVQPFNEAIDSFQDLRTFAADLAARPYQTIVGTAASVVSAPVSHIRGRIAEAASFADPNKTMVCVRRAVRREVLHALGLQSRGAGGRRRRTPRSNIRC